MSVPDSNAINLKDFPTTRYRGSKRIFLPWIQGHLGLLNSYGLHRFSSGAVRLTFWNGSGSLCAHFLRAGMPGTYLHKAV